LISGGERSAGDESVLRLDLARCRRYLGRMSAPRRPIALLSSIAELSTAADAWICDIWGVLHNGVAPFPEAGEACCRFRELGGRVVLVSNSPRLAPAVARQMAEVGVPAGAYDAIITSGDATRECVRRLAGRPIHHLGPPAFLPLFDGLGARLAELDAAEAVVCTGLLDDRRETPDDYAAVLATMRRRDLEMICVNPDLTVERGGQIIYCAGAIAEAYERLGGRVLYAGKPHVPIYLLAFARIAELAGRPVAPQRMLAIGDGIRTDIRGAGAAGIASVFVASAIHVSAPLDEARLAALFANEPHPPIAAMASLRW
jgi:HAD superfamily hydrolase (TIGR01459 family)